MYIHILRCFFFMAIWAEKCLRNVLRFYKKQNKNPVLLTYCVLSLLIAAMRRKKTMKCISSSESNDDEPLVQKTKKNSKDDPINNEESSSESDIENYLQPVDKIDLNSSFFTLQKDTTPLFDEIENDIFAGVTRLIDSGEESEKEVHPPEAEAIASTSKLNFRQLHDYSKKLEEARKHVEEYNMRRKTEQKQEDVFNLLAVGESRLSHDQQIDVRSDFTSASDDSEKEDFEEVLVQQKNENQVPRECIQITVEMPGAVKKKKGVDLFAAIKRRLNRVRKENQILVHKVHLLCWIAHGNYVSSVINSQNVLALALSLLPSQQCYPADRANLSYLEQILKWYNNTIVNTEKSLPNDKSLNELLQLQITKKETFNKNMLVYIFIAILRSLGIQCRLVLSFQVEPLRPPNSEIFSTNAKTENSRPVKVEQVKVKARSKSVIDTSKFKNEETKTRSKSLNEYKVRESRKPEIEDKVSDKRRVSSKSINEKEKEAELIKRKICAKRKQENIDGSSEEKRSSTNTNGTKTGIKKRSTFKLKKESEQTESVSKVRLNETKKRRSKMITSSIESAVGTEKNTFKSTAVAVNSGIAKEKKTTSSKRITRKPTNQNIPQVDGVNDSSGDEYYDTETLPKPNLKRLKEKATSCSIKDRPKRCKTKSLIKYKDSSEDESDDDFTNTSPFSDSKKKSPKTNGGVNLEKLNQNTKTKEVDVRNDIINIIKSRIKEQKQIDRSKLVHNKRKNDPQSDDSDYVLEEPKKKHRDRDDDNYLTPKIKRRVGEKTEEVVKKKKVGTDVWAEIFLETEEKWISVDVVKGQIHCINELFTRATHPVSYIVAWNNNNSLKDITIRYCKHFNTVTRKLRVDSKWWEATIKPFIGKRTVQDREEDEELEKHQLDRPLPTSIAEYKNHPLYVLKRHLLKFEAIYPPEAPPLGYCRNEPVYNRQCVYTLHSREIWLKHAKVVKPGEKPYKIVKARPKWDKLSNKMITDLELEIFGPWQTQDYEPPSAENGIVPRNAFGNVELFKSSMLPKKTVHLQLPGLHKIAKRLNIDCAAAVTGFDFHGGWNHPVYDGFVVCEEFKDVLINAWEEEREELGKKEQAKVDKRIYGNWKRLIRGLLIRERLKIKYEFGESSDNKKKGKNISKATNISKRK